MGGQAICNSTNDQLLIRNCTALRLVKLKILYESHSWGEQMDEQMDVDMDQDAIRHRVSATCCGTRNVEVGHLVRHIETKRVYQVVNVVDVCPDAHFTESNQIIVVELDRSGRPLGPKGEESCWVDERGEENPYFTDDFFPIEDPFEPSNEWTYFTGSQTTLNRWLGLGGPDKVVATPHKEFRAEHAAAFCECCNMHFEEKYVTWWWDNDGLPRYFYHRSRPGNLLECHSMCRRCKHDYPQGRVLWRWLRSWIRARAITQFLYKLAHAPKYVSRLDAEMRADLQNVL